MPKKMTINRRHMLLFTAACATQLFTFSAFATEADAETDIGVLKPNGIRHVTATEAATLIVEHPEVIVLDVRTGSEFKAGHIEGAQNINYLSWCFRKRVSQLDTTKTYLVHCKSGNRSARAVPIMKKAGIENIIHMDGGFDAWKAANRD